MGNRNFYLLLSFLIMTPIEYLSAAAEFEKEYLCNEKKETQEGVLDTQVLLTDELGVSSEDTHSTDVNFLEFGDQEEKKGSAEGIEVPAAYLPLKIVIEDDESSKIETYVIDSGGSYQGDLGNCFFRSITILLQDNIMVAGIGWNVHIYDCETGVCVKKLLKGHTDIVTAVAFSPDGTYVVSGSWDGMVCIWHVGTGICLMTLKKHKNYVSWVAFSSDGQYIASKSFDRGIPVWSIDILVGVQDQEVVAVPDEDDRAVTAAPALDRATNACCTRCLCIVS